MRDSNETEMGRILRRAKVDAREMAKNAIHAIVPSPNRNDGRLKFTPPSPPIATSVHRTR